jgi:hypothetical protein
MVKLLHYTGQAPRLARIFCIREETIHHHVCVCTGASEAHHEVMTGTAAHIIELDDIAEAGFRSSFVLESSMAR